MKTKLKVAAFFLLATTAQAGPAGCRVDPSDYEHFMAGGAGPIKQFHVTGRHQCQSRENIGYWAAIETRDASDCTSGHSRLMMQNPCGWYNGQAQTNGQSIGYTPGRCTPFL